MKKILMFLSLLLLVAGVATDQCVNLSLRL